MSRNYILCPVCGRETGTADDYSVPAGPLARKYKCMPCEALDKKPRTPLRLADAMEFAKRQVNAGCHVYLRDCETNQTKQFSKFSKYSPADFDVTEPDSLVIACAVK